MISGPTDLNHRRPRQFYVIPDDDVVDSEAIGMSADEGLGVRVTGVVLDDRRSKV